MPILFSVTLKLSPVEIGLIFFSGLGFIIMFIYSSVTGGYQDLIKTTLENDEAIRQKDLTNRR